MPGYQKTGQQNYLPAGILEIMAILRICLVIRVLNEKKPFKGLNFERLCGPSWA